MNVKNFLWHRRCNARLYESAGSRVPFKELWNANEKHEALPEEEAPEHEKAIEAMIDQKCSRRFSVQAVSQVLRAVGRNQIV